MKFLKDIAEIKKAMKEMSYALENIQMSVYTIADILTKGAAEDKPKKKPINKSVKKPVVSKKDAEKALQKFTVGFEAMKASRPNNQEIGVKVSYYVKSTEKGKPPEKKEDTFMGANSIQEFIEKAKKDEVRILVS